MPWTIESALENEHLHDVRQLIGHFQFKLGALSPHITIRLYRPVGGTTIEWSQSHLIKTPLLAEPYLPAKTWGDYEANALWLATTGLTQHYTDALAKGHKPDDSWLIPNRDF